MNVRKAFNAILNYESYDRMPVMHFGFWQETLAKWVNEGHLTQEEAGLWSMPVSLPDGRPICRKLGFDDNSIWVFSPMMQCDPPFESKVIERLPEGVRKELNEHGVVVLVKEGVVSIPQEVDYLLKTRSDWEEHFLHRLKYHDDRVLKIPVRVNDQTLTFDEGGLEFLKKDERDYHYGLFCGSMFGDVRNMLGVEGASYMFADDPELIEEIIAARADLNYRCIKKTLESGAKFDYAHYWEDICFKNGPLINPSVFDKIIGPHYKRATNLLHQYGINIISVDCDGMIDSLIPTWIENGVNVMLPIEVGTWHASIAPWREQYGRELRGFGGMDKRVFAQDRAAVDAEIERLKPLVDLGGFIPLPDHSIAPEAEWDSVRYYCDRMHETF